MGPREIHRRDRVKIATKLPSWMVQAEADVERLLDEQLKKLDTDHIDFYLLHALNEEWWSNLKRAGALKILERAQADGRIRHFGFSFHDSLRVFKEIIDSYDWEFCQIQYNFLDEGFQAGAEGLEYAATRQVGVIAMEPLRGGTLAVPQPAKIQQIWARAARQRPPADWALRWVWNHPAMITALSGMNAESQLAENLAAADLAETDGFSAEELDLFQEVRNYYASRMVVPCTTCGYCSPCPKGVAIPITFSAYNTGSMFDTWKSAAWSYDTFTVKAGHGADQCTQCGACEPQCPQGIPIIEKLKEAHRALAQAL
ncbi:aldo/keto reductase [Holophaga foetida]|uniref:aldo/keto reductase n=1 Tax=Holophaga foetida TaxID=35839 RepID=UPI0002471811|nr:aldo/keto reductase [Holophaga foetida]